MDEIYIFIIGAFLAGFLVGITDFFGLFAPQPFDAYFNSKQINFWDFDDFRLACDSVAGEIQCGPECTCNLRSRQEMINLTNKAGELVNECADKAMIVIDERDKCLEELNKR